MFHVYLAHFFSLMCPSFKLIHTTHLSRVPNVTTPQFILDNLYPKYCRCWIWFKEFVGINMLGISVNDMFSQKPSENCFRFVFSSVSWRYMLELAFYEIFKFLWVKFWLWSPKTFTKNLETWKLKCLWSDLATTRSL